MSSKRDSVFQVSLTEIAFTIILLLVMLFGARLTSSIRTEHEQAAQLAEKTREVEILKEQLQQFGGICKPDPEDPVEPMMPCIKCVSVLGKMTKEEAADSLNLGQELMRLWKALQHPDRKLTVDDYKQLLLANGRDYASSPLTREEIERRTDLGIALDEIWRNADPELRPTYDEYEDLLKQIAERLVKGERPIWAEELNEEQKKLQEALAAIDKLQAEAEQHRADLQACEKTTEFFRRRAGMDLPPCWVTDDGKSVQYLFNVRLMEPDRVEIVPGWIPEREAEAMSMAPVRSMVEKQFMTMSEFRTFGRELLKLSVDSKGEACRHFVRMKNEIEDRAPADRARLTLEQYFYKYELN